MAVLEPRAEPRVYERDGFVVTLWTYYTRGPVEFDLAHVPEDVSERYPTLTKNCSVSAESLFWPWSLCGAGMRATNSRMGNEQLMHSWALYALVHRGRRSMS